MATHIFVGLPGAGSVNPCNSTGEKTDCSNNNLQQIPDALNKNDIIEYNLSRNSIEEIDDESFEGLNSLEILDLSYNSIYSFKNNPFKTLKNLKIMDLSHNIIWHLPVDIFSNNLVLEELYLNNNNFYTIPKLPSTLKYINLKSSGISEISPLHLPSLKYIDISHNKLKTISLETRVSLTYVEKVILIPNPWKCSYSFHSSICWIYDVAETEDKDISCHLEGGRTKTYNREQECNPATKIQNQIIIYSGQSNPGKVIFDNTYEQRETKQAKDISTGYTESTNMDYFSSRIHNVSSIDYVRETGGQHYQPYTKNVATEGYHVYGEDDVVIEYAVYSVIVLFALCVILGAIIVFYFFCNKNKPIETGDVENPAYSEVQTDEI